MAYDVEIVDRQREDAAVVRGRVPQEGVGAFIGAAFPEVLAGLGGVPVTGPPFCKVDMDGDAFLLEVGFPVERAIEPNGKVQPSRLSAGLVATVVHVGSYESVPAAYAYLEEWMGQNGYAPVGPPWETYLDGPEVAEPRTIVTWPVERQ